MRWRDRAHLTIETVLDAAMACFWRDGYEATSIRELAAEMAWMSPSLYNAFGESARCFGKC